MTARRRWDFSRTGRVSSFGDKTVTGMDGGVDRSGRRRNCVWPEVWEACQRAGLSPTDLVETRFSMVTSAVAPDPRDLLHPRVIEEARRRRGSNPERVRKRVASQLRAIQTVARYRERLGLPDPVDRAFYSSEACGAPLARHLFALALNRQDLIDLSFWPAAEELCVRRAEMVEPLKDVLPLQLIAAVDQLSVDFTLTPDSQSRGGRQ